MEAKPESCQTKLFYIISITGNKGSGKDTVADYLCSKYDFKKFAFADPIKHLALNIFDFSEDTLWGSSEKREVPDERYPIRKKFGDMPDWLDHTYVEFLKPRTVLTTFGDAGRACYPDIWAEKTIRNIQHTQKYNVGFKGAVISDCRMKNELAVVKKHGGKTIRIKRKNLINTSTHSSETEQLEIPDSDFDYVINNDSSLIDLEKEIEKCMKTLGIE